MTLDQPSQGKKKNNGAGCSCLGLAAIVIGVLVAMNSGSDTSAVPDDPFLAAATRLSSEDAGDGHAHPASDYRLALQQVSPKCAQDPARIGMMIDNTLADLVKNNVTDEDRLSVTQHLSQSVPSSLGKTDCAGILAAYLTLRES